MRIFTRSGLIATSFTQSLGSAYDEAINQNLNPDQAMAYAFMTSIVQS
jgi:hypothetical protein